MLAAMATQSVIKSQAMQTRPRGAPRALSQVEIQPLRRYGQREAGKLYVSGVSHAMTSGEKTHENDQDSEFTNLFNKALCCAIGPCRDNPIVNTLDVEDTPNCLQKVITEGESYRENLMSRADGSRKTVRKTM